MRGLFRASPLEYSMATKTLEHLKEENRRLLALLSKRDAGETRQNLRDRVKRLAEEVERLKLAAQTAEAKRKALEEAVQYAVNRLDAEEDQPQVSGDLAVALAASKSV